MFDLLNLHQHLCFSSGGGGGFSGKGGRGRGATGRSGGNPLLFSGWWGGEKSYINPTGGGGRFSQGWSAFKHGGESNTNIKRWSKLSTLKREGRRIVLLLRAGGIRPAGLKAL